MINRSDTSVKLWIAYMLFISMLYADSTQFFNVLNGFGWLADWLCEFLSVRVIFW